MDGGSQAQVRQKQRIPLEIPNGWYIVAYSDDVARGEIKHLKYFNEEQVLFRGEDGTAGLLDAYCDHLGAHLAYGGKVVDNCVQCPFHNWKWTTEGRCASIPYATVIPANARVRHYPVREHSGFIWAWYHHEGKAPPYELPTPAEYGSPDWTTDWLRYEFHLKSHPQEIMENAVDYPHFSAVHGMDAPSNAITRYDGHEFHWGLNTNRDFADGREAIQFESRIFGLGISFLRCTGDFASLGVVGFTPISNDETHIRMAYIGNKANTGDRSALKAYADQHVASTVEDFEIWSHKKYRAQPKLCHRDGPLLEFRQWASQFYA